MSSSPLVTIVTPTYRAARFLPQAIASAQAQSERDWEMVVVDDASRDGTREILADASAADPRIRWESAEANRGAGPTRNRALALARGRYVAFLDADDLWDPAKLERQLGFMRRSNLAFSFTGYRVITESGEARGAVTRIPRRMAYADLLKNTVIGCLTVVLDREQVGPIEFAPLRTSQDTALWLSILRRGVVAHGLPEVLASYRLVGGSNTRNKLRAARGVWTLYREVERLPILRAGWCFAHYAVRGLAKHLSTGAGR